jgi:hypothetical protein
LFLLLPNNTIASSEELSKTIEKTIKVNKDAVLKISNQFGKIDLINQDKNEVEIFVKITVESSNVDKAQKRLDQIDVKISGSMSLVDIKTVLEKSGSNFNGSFSIDYTIKAPATMNLSLHNEFGDVFIGEWAGPTTIDVQYGSLTVGKLLNESNELELQFSKGSVGLINKGELNLSYVDRFNLDKSKDLILKSSFSKVDIETLEHLDCHSEYDGIEIGEANRIELKASFSAVKIGKLHLRGDLSNEYGAIKIASVSKGFEGLEIENSFASIKVTFEKGSQFNFECNAEFGDISMPGEADVRIDKKDISEHYLKGKVGDGSDLPNLNIEVEYGSASIDID